MSKFLGKCALFFGVLIALNLIYLLILFLFSLEFIKINESYSFKNQNNELLVFGNSMALDGIDSEYLTKKGIKTYNFSVPGDHISTSLLQLEEYLKYNKKPKSIIIGLSSLLNGRQYLNNISFQNPEVEFFYHPSLVKNITNPPLFNFQWLTVELIKTFLSKDHRNAKIVLGQWKTGKVVADKSKYIKQQQLINLDYNNPYFFKIIDICKKNGIKLILVELPGENAKRNNLPYIYFKELLNKKKIKVYNLNNYEISSKIIDSSNDWLSRNHLNKNGAKKITTFILENCIKNEN